MPKLPKDITNIILTYIYQLEHAEKLDRVHSELFIKAFLYIKPRRILSVSYFFMLDDTTSP